MENLKVKALPLHDNVCRFAGCAGNDTRTLSIPVGVAKSIRCSMPSMSWQEPSWGQVLPF